MAHHQYVINVNVKCPSSNTDTNAHHHGHPAPRPAMSLTLSLEQLRRGGAPRLRAERAVDLATSLALLPIAVKVALPATADANTVKLELIQLLDNRIGTFST